MAWSQRFFALCLAFALCSPAIGDSPLPSVEQIMQRFIDATGGAEAYRSIGSILQVGRANGDLVRGGKWQEMFPNAGGLRREHTHQVGTWEFARKGATQSLTALLIAGKGRILSGCNGGPQGWYFSDGPDLPYRNEKDRSDTPCTDDLKWPLEWRTEYAKWKVEGIKTINGTKAYRVRFWRKHGESEDIYFDIATGLMVAERYQGGGADYSDYRDVGGGLKVHFHFVQTWADFFTMEVQLQSVEVNPKIDSKIFDPPIRQK
jgi:hypothetical protein